MDPADNRLPGIGVDEDGKEDGWLSFPRCGVGQDRWREAVCVGLDDVNHRIGIIDEQPINNIKAEGLAEGHNHLRLGGRRGLDRQIKVDPQDILIVAGYITDAAVRSAGRADIRVERKGSRGQV